MNSRGHVVVEVDKVLRDLNMLHNTIKMAKFYRILIGAQESGNGNQTIEPIELQPNQDQDRVVQNYRDSLNEFFKLIVRLNNSTEQLTQQSEIYKLRLLNVDLKQQIQQYRQETSG